MKIRLLLLTAVFGLVAGPVVRAADEPQTELGQKMEKVGGAFRALRRQISDPSKNADSLARLATMRENLQAALKFEPAKTEEVPAAQKKQFVADFQAEMKNFIGLIEKVEAALKAGDNDGASKLVTQMGDEQKKAHKQFKKDDKKKK